VNHRQIDLRFFKVIIARQTLDVDAVYSAKTTRKALMKAVENSLFAGRPSEIKTGGKHDR
jgi:uncharacterized protein with FMN-binding domain